MVEIKLPKPFGHVLRTYYSDRDYTLVHAYLDSAEYTNLPDECKCLRELLAVNGDETCCDCYCIVQLKDGKKEGILMEDKDIQKHRNREVNDGIRQMTFIHDKLKEKNGNYPLTWAFLINAKFQAPLKARSISGRRSKVLFNEISGRPVKIRNSEIEIFVV